MCGRFTVGVPPELIEAELEASGAQYLPLGVKVARYNVAPTQDVVIVKRAVLPAAESRRVLEVARWGLAGAAKMINARQETVFEKQPFASAVRARRCLVPADGFFEWKNLETWGSAPNPPEGSSENLAASNLAGKGSSENLAASNVAGRGSSENVAGSASSNLAASNLAGRSSSENRAGGASSKLVEGENSRGGGKISRPRKKKGGLKQAYRFRMANGELFAMAGIFAKWEAPWGEWVETVSILTTEPNAVVAPIWDRMPVILARESWDLWLDSSIKAREPLEPLFVPFPAELMVADPVSARVNDVDNDDASLIEVVEPIVAPPAVAKPKQLGFDF